MMAVVLEIPMTDVATYAVLWICLPEIPDNFPIVPPEFCFPKIPVIGGT
jgi:hypothetical protein